MNKANKVNKRKADKMNEENKEKANKKVSKLDKMNEENEGNEGNEGKVDKEIDIQINQLCKRLRTPGIYESYSKSHVDKECKNFLIKVLKSEVESRNNNAIVKRIKHAGFPTLKRFEELVKEYLPKDAQNRLEELKSLEFLKQNRNIIMLGNSGTGKTHLATAI